MKTQLLAASALAASVFGVGAARADSTFYFTGNCSDCSNPLGVLTLSGDDPRPTVSSDNFISFTYSSSVVPGFTFTKGSYASGSLTTLPGPDQTSFTGKTVSGSGVLGSFYSRTDGTWNFSENNFGLDGGSDGTWSASMPDQVASAPEPATWAMLAGGVAVMGAALRMARRRRPTLSAA